MRKSSRDWTAMGAVVRVLGCRKVDHQLFHLGMAEGVSGLDGHFARRHDPNLLAGRDKFSCDRRFHQLIDEVFQILDRVFAAQGGGDGADDIGVSTKRL